MIVIMFLKFKQLFIMLFISACRDMCPDGNVTFLTLRHIYAGIHGSLSIPVSLACEIKRELKRRKHYPPFRSNFCKSAEALSTINLARPYILLRNSDLLRCLHRCLLHFWNDNFENPIFILGINVTLLHIFW
jgi:hypothetical protein